MNSVKRNKAVFPHLKDKVFFDLKFALFNLDFSVRECSVRNLSTYQELCAQFEDPETSSGHEKNNPEIL